MSQHFRDVIRAEGNFGHLVWNWAVPADKIQKTFSKPWRHREGFEIEERERDAYAAAEPRMGLSLIAWH